MQGDDTVFCENCNSKILRKCQVIHSLACKNKNKTTKPKMLLGKKSSVKQQNQEMIPCLECGQSIAFSVYTQHQNQCFGHQLTKCQRCKILFPTFLFQEHLQVCQGPKNVPKQQLFNVPEAKKQNNVKNVKKEQIKEQKMFDDLFNDSSDEDEEQNPLYMMIGQMARNQIQNVKLTQDPLKQDNLKKLNQVSLSNEEQCSICCCRMKKKTKHIKLNCKHIYHKKCIFSWLRKNPCCPMCRQHALKK